MRRLPRPIRNLDLRDRLSELLGEALCKPERAAPLYVLRSFWRLVKARGGHEVLYDALLGAGENGLREVGLRVSAMEAVEGLVQLKLLQRRREGVGEGWVAPGGDLREELPAALSRIEAYCRALEALSRCPIRATGELERAIKEGACLFNEGLFFEVHEILEVVWMKQQGQTRLLLQGLIQIAVGFHHLENGNLSGALGLLKDGLEKVRGHRPARFGLELDQFLDQAEACYHSIESLGGEAFSGFDRQMIPTMRLLR